MTTMRKECVQCRPEMGVGNSRIFTLVNNEEYDKNGNRIKIWEDVEGHQYISKNRKPKE